MDFNIDKFMDILYLEYLIESVAFEKITKWQWDRFKKQIDERMHYLNGKDKDNNVRLSEAAGSWLEYVFEPFISKLKKTKLLKYSSLNIVELYFNVYDYWRTTDYKYIDSSFDEYICGLNYYPLWRKLILRKSFIV